MRRRFVVALVALVVVSAVAAVAASTAEATPTDPGTSAGGTSPETVSCSFPFEEPDAGGTRVTLDSDPHQIVTLQPGGAQTMWEIGGRDEVVGMPVNQYTAGLDGYREKTNVVGADDYTTDVEAVVNLTPDLVLASNVTPSDTVDQLRRAGLTVFHFREAQTIDDVYAKTLVTGQLTGNCDGAVDRVAWMRERIDRVREAVRDEDRPTTVYPLGGGVVAGSGTFLHELIVTAGGSNLAAEAGISGYGQINAEVIVDRDPQWLILNEGLPSSAIQMDAYNRTTSIRRDQIVRVNPNNANQPAPRIVYPIESIARSLHPEAMAEMNGTLTASGGTANTDSSPETNAPGQAGFGVVAGLVALLVAILVVRRSGS